MSTGRANHHCGAIESKASHPSKMVAGVFLLGGGAPVDDVVIENCFTHEGGLQLGYAASAKEQVGDRAEQLLRWWN